MEHLSPDEVTVLRLAHPDWFDDEHAFQDGIAELLRQNPTAYVVHSVTEETVFTPRVFCRDCGSRLFDLDQAVITDEAGTFISHDPQGRPRYFGQCQNHGRVLGVRTQKEGC